MENAISGIPYLYDRWTDFNEHDPGITILELFAWYKQMQQYHLNRITDRNKLMLLKLMGIRPRRIRETNTMLCFSESVSGLRLCEGTRLYSEGKVTFELAQSVTAGEITFKEAYILRSDGMHEVTSILLQRQVPLKITGNEVLYLGLDGLEKKESFKLWFEIDDSYPIKRNQFAENDRLPREICLEASGSDGVRALEIIKDETYGLSFSGYMELGCENGISPTDGGRSLLSHSWIMLKISDSGCEEDPALMSVTADFAPARQRVTSSEVSEFTISSADKVLEVSSWLALQGKTDVFARDELGWYELQPKGHSIAETAGVTALRLDIEPEKLAFDGKPNARVICYDPAFRSVMRQSSTGLPNQRIKLLLSGGEKPLADELCVMCRSATSDGGQRYHDWTYVDSIEDAGPHDNAFTYDDEEGLIFGDYECGAVPERGRNAVYLAGFAVSEGGEGAITEGQELFLPVKNEDDTEKAKLQEAAASAFAVRMGRDREDIASGIAELEAIWGEGRAATATDFELVAKRTPGRRVAQAKALPLYEPENVIQEDTPGLMTLVVLPYSEKPYPMPDERFLGCVRRHVEKYRMICTRINVIAPVYVAVNIRADVIANTDEQTVNKKVKAALESFFSLASNRELGAEVSRSGVLGAIGGVENVLGVTDVNISAEGNRCKYSKHGDVIIQKHGIAYLGTLEIRVSQQ